MSSSQLTNSYFSEGWPWPTNQDCHCWHKIQLFYSAAWLSRWAHRWSPLAHCQIVWNQPWFAGPPWFPVWFHVFNGNLPMGSWLKSGKSTAIFLPLFLSILFPNAMKKINGFIWFLQWNPVLWFPDSFPAKKKKEKNMFFFPKDHEKSKNPMDFQRLTGPFHPSLRFPQVVTAGPRGPQCPGRKLTRLTRLRSLWEIVLGHYTGKLGKQLFNHLHISFFLCVSMLLHEKEPQFWDGWMLFQQPFLGCGSQ